VLTAMGLSVAGAGIVASVASSNMAQSVPWGSHARAHGEAVERQNLHLHDHHLSKQAQGDLAGLHHDYAEHAIVEDSMHPEAFVGRAAIMGRKGIGMAAIPDLEIEVVNRVAKQQQVTVEWIARGTHSGDLHGLPATGRPFAIQGVTVVVREQGKITREAIYYDMHEVRRQLSL
jgi:steroid delta-isomerase-like uncharacterized protein